MLIVHVFIHVKPDHIQDFIEATIENSKASFLELGIARFDFIQELADPSRFVLVEVYRTSDDPAKHKETSHYAKWRDVVAPMMAELRTSVKYGNVYPDDEGW